MQRQKLSILTQPYRIKPLLTPDDLVPAADLVQIIKDLEELVLAGSGADSFQEIFKLIYAKLYDEKKAGKKGVNLMFQYRTESLDSYKNIQILFEQAKQEWPGIFHPSEIIELSPAHLIVCIKALERIKLFATNLEIIDTAFEYLLPTVAKGKRGQYFTPRHIITAAVKMLNPKNDELILDPACGSGGFLLHTIRWINERENIETRLAVRQVFGIDFDDKAAKIARAMLLIAGHGDGIIFKINSLENIDEIMADRILSSFTAHNEGVLFDVVLTNPPFGGEIHDPDLLATYSLAKDNKGSQRKAVERHILFLERIIQFLKPGGRAAVIVPQGILNNTNLSYIRDWLFRQSRLLAVIGLDANTFKPHTNVKTSLLLLQKWNVEKPTDYPVFMAVSQKGGKNQTGDPVFKTGKNGNLELDHDLDEIAEGLINFVKREKLGFWEE